MPATNQKWREIQKARALRENTAKALEFLRAAYAMEPVKSQFGLYVRLQRNQTQIKWASSGVMQAVIWCCPNAEFMPIITAMLAELKRLRTADARKAAA